MKPLSLRNRWVLVTGASSGLGQEMARQLANNYGAHLLITARRAERLEALRAELEERARIQVKTIPADLSDMDEVDRVAEVAQGYPLAAAVLNAGVTHFGPHKALDWARFEQILHTNVSGVVRMSNALIPTLSADANAAGALMLVASMAGLTPVPYQTAYSGTKAFLVHFGCGLAAELEGQPVSLTTYCPGGVKTEMTAGESFAPLRRWLVPVEGAARDGLRAMIDRKMLYVPGTSNRLGNALLKLVPKGLASKLVGNSYRDALKRTGGL